MTAQTAAPAASKTFPPFKPGDTVRIHLRVVEGDSERVQVFEGIVLRRRGVGVSETFTVRKISFGIGVERIFPIHSPRIDKIELVRSGRVRRARLYYMRKLTGKAARMEEDTRESARPSSTEAKASSGPDEKKAAPASPAPITT